ncbi:MAG TPA: SMP-30/gluconolactonase/LRE family protein [Flavobacteriales bacterium]|nr:SMP-30/gluconolactonase/LRE family protein [Flavobacteriales bacterium]
MRHCLLFAALLAAPAMAQYNGPESVEYDPAGDRYFVSNTSSGMIKVRNQAGAVSDFVSVSPSPYGLELMGDVVYACSGGTIKGYALSNAAQVFNLNLGATFLNGITTDGEYIYATDFNSSQRKVYKVDVAANSASVLVANTGGQPNGIVWDPIGDRLVVVFWGTNAPIKAYDRVTGAETVLTANSGLGNCDGVTIDCLGNFLVASWSPTRISRFEPTFASAGVNLGVAGLSSPADIDFDHVNNKVCIPNSGNNTVVLHDIDCTLGVPSSAAPVPLRAIPNPTPGLVRLDPPLSRDEPYLLLDARGLLVGGGTLKQGAQLDISRLSKGMYTIELTRAKQRVRVVKE